MVDKVTFSGSFPPIASAIKISGNGDGMRIMIDIPESEMAKALMLMMFRQVPITVTIEPYEDTLQNRVGQGNGKKQHELQERPKRKSEWSAAEKSRPDSDT
jgi:hypothetical protein